jgi:3-phosphoshikimate 1-carboxyvinyltransferase
MNLITAPGKPLRGILELPGDKSISHRAALFAALAEGESCIENFLVAGVTKVMLNGLENLGATWELDGTKLTVLGQGFKGTRFDQAAAHFDCGNSGTTLRLLTGACAALGIPAVLDGSAGLRRRPMKRIVAPLQAMGVLIEASQENTAPLKLSARPKGKQLQHLDYTLPVASAQVKSCLLLAGLAADGTTRLQEPGPSRDHTERMLRSMGVDIQASMRESDDSGKLEYITQIIPPDSKQLSPLDLAIPGDISSAAFLIVAACITPGSQLSLQNVGLNPTRTGLLSALQSMGADIQVTPQGERSGEPVGDIEVRYAPLQAKQVSGPLVVRMIDEFPAFTVAAAHARGQTVVSQANELRHKESDRIGALCTGLRELGIRASETRDGFVIDGGPKPEGGVIHAHGDHRLAMAFAIAGLASQGKVTVRGAEIISESFPGFTTQLRRLGADIRVEM